MELPELIAGQCDANVDLNFVAEFLESVDDPNLPQSSTSRRSARRRASVASSARRHRAREKAQRLELKQQVETLESQLNLLRRTHRKSRGDGNIAEWEERAATQRHRRKQAETLNQQLKTAVVAQRGFLIGFMGVAAAVSEHSDELNMTALLHTHTRLRKGLHLRLQDLQGLVARQQLDLATTIVLQETQRISFDTCKPWFRSRRVQAGAGEFAVTNTALYAVDTADVAKTFAVACHAYLERSDPDWLEYVLQCYQSNSIDLPTSCIRYNICTATYRNTEGHEVCLEGRGISYYRVNESSAVIVWDFVDMDELYPLEKETDVKRDAVGAVVIHRELCGDGAERVALRSICTKTLRLYSLKNMIVSQDIIGVPDTTIQGMKASMTRVYDSIQASHKHATAGAW